MTYFYIETTLFPVEGKFVDENEQVSVSSEVFSVAVNRFMHRMGDDFPFIDKIGVVLCSMQNGNFTILNSFKYKPNDFIKLIKEIL